MSLPQATPELVFVTNLGTPRAATPDDVREFLDEFLSDPQVVDYPAFFWRPLLRGIILRKRPARVAEMYRSILTKGGEMPLAVDTETITRRLAELLGSSFDVHASYRYGSASISALLAPALRAGRSAAVVPLFPQRTSSSSETIVDEVERIAKAAGAATRARIVRIPADDPGYIEALADRVRSVGSFQHLVISFHGIPRRYDRREGRIYSADCALTARALTTRLGLAKDDASLCFQSRFGPEPWLGPTTFDTLQAVAKRGVRAVAVVTPGFLTEGLETLEEIGVRGREVFVDAGGTDFARVPAVCDHPAFVASLARGIRETRSGHRGDMTSNES